MHVTETSSADGTLILSELRAATWPSEAGDRPRPAWSVPDRHLRLGVLAAAFVTSARAPRAGTLRGPLPATQVLHHPFDNRDNEFRLIQRNPVTAVRRDQVTSDTRTGRERVLLTQAVVAGIG